MTNKKENIKRLGIYLLIVAASSVMLFIAFKPLRNSETAFFLLGQQLFCAAPALANIITRKATKEGFRDMKLHMHLIGNERYYMLAFALPIVYTFLMYIPPMILSGHSDWLNGFTFANILTVILTLAAQGAVMSAGLIGEELGWRGYMNRKMEPLVGIVGTVLIGGAVWSLWHLPSDIRGYLAGEQLLSEAMKAVLGRLLIMPGYAAFYMWLTKKTDSVWPAVLSHATGNASYSALLNILKQGDLPEDASMPSWTDALNIIPMLIIAVIFTVLLIRDKKKKPRSA